MHDFFLNCRLVSGWTAFCPPVIMKSTSHINRGQRQVFSLFLPIFILLYMFNNLSSTNPCKFVYHSSNVLGLSRLSHRKDLKIIFALWLWWHHLLNSIIGTLVTQQQLLRSSDKEKSLGLFDADRDKTGQTPVKTVTFDSCITFCFSSVGRFNLPQRSELTGLLFRARARAITRWNRG